jgi:site-specific DNA-cytosine methylase
VKHGSLFSGFGGIDRGFESAGIRTIWRIDAIEGKDIREERPEDYEFADIISGGPPCQKGSTAAAFSGNRTKETLWPEMLRFVTQKKPSWVVVENVSGFRDEMVGWSLELQRLGYGCFGQGMDSRHWVPQQRTRFFVIGRMGADGMALRNNFYADGERMEGGKHSAAIRQRESGNVYVGSCPDCLRGGIYSRVSARKSALVAAGNAVTQPLAEWIGRRIIEVECGAEREGGAQ